MAASLTYSQLTHCANCGTALQTGALVCPNCRKFTHSQELDQLAGRARQATALGHWQAARDFWASALPLLPPESSEYQSVQREITKLDARLNPNAPNDWKKRLGPVGVGIAALLKYKTAAFILLTKFKFILSIVAFLGFYWALFGWWFALGITGSIFLHEMGHYIVVRRYGFAAELPMFLPGFGAYVKWRGSNVDPGVRAQIALAGPLLGFVSGVIAYGLYLSTGRPVWLAVAHVAGWINLLNLIPVLIFDGATAMVALGLQGRLAVLFVSLAMFAMLHDFLFLFVALGTGYRLYVRDFPSEPRQNTAYYFSALVLANGFLSWFAMNQSQAVFGR